MRAHAVVVLLLLTVTGTSCGSKQVEEPSEPEPPWVKDYQRVATAGCACGDAACLDKAHAELEKMVADHGGIDEAPPSVHEAHGEFEQCWRSGTKDIARDLSDAADAVCKCRETACINAYNVQLIHIGDRYRANLDAPATLDERARPALERGKACVAAVTVPADEYVEIIARTTKQFCECGAVDCIRTVYKDRSKAFGDRFIIGDKEQVKPRVEKIREAYCRCLTTAISKGIESKTLKPETGKKIDQVFKCGEQ